MEQLTYDIVNCGPRKRFVANGKMVHNSEKLNLQNLGRGSELRKSLIAPSGQLVYVVDSSNIEARMLAWESKHTALLTQFANHEDVYSNFASAIYEMPINKKEHPLQRHVGKTCVLGLGYQVGWKKLQSSLATNQQMPVQISEEESRAYVRLYRTVNHPIVSFWQACENAITDMYLGNQRQWGPITIYKECLVMPNGMALQYPGLKPSAPDELGRVGWEYWNGKFWTNLYGGKLCLAAGTLVLTRTGWQAIESIVANTEVWDGGEWVFCGGNVYNGGKTTLSLSGVRMTADHEVLTDEGWKAASQSAGHNRAESRLPNGGTLRWERWEEIPVVSPVRLRDRSSNSRHRTPKDEKSGGDSVVWLQERRVDIQTAHDPRDVTTPSVRSLAQYARSVQTTYASSVGKLRRAGHSCLRKMAGIVRSILGGHGEHVPAGAYLGAAGQRGALFARELHVGHLYHAGEQPAQLDSGRGTDRQSAITRVRDTGINDSVQARSWLALEQDANSTRRNQPVYDLVNCGPRNRFVVRDANGMPMIVHNCENLTQAMSRIVLFTQMLAINALFTPVGGRVCLNVHDEIVAVGPIAGADELFEQMLAIMRTPPPWAPDLPLDAEGGMDVSYSK